MNRIRNQALQLKIASRSARIGKWATSLLAYSQIRLNCQRSHELEERLRLADKECVGGESVDRSHGLPVGFRRTNDRTCGKLPAKEGRGLGHDQVVLEIFATKRRRVQVGESHVHAGYGIHDIG